MPAGKVIPGPGRAHKDSRKVEFFDSCTGATVRNIREVLEVTFSYSWALPVKPLLLATLRCANGGNCTGTMTTLNATATAHLFNSTQDLETTGDVEAATWRPCSGKIVPHVTVIFSIRVSVTVSMR